MRTISFINIEHTKVTEFSSSNEHKQHDNASTSYATTAGLPSIVLDQSISSIYVKVMTILFQ